jgi:hypothetical protein
MDLEQIRGQEISVFKNTSRPNHFLSYYRQLPVSKDGKTPPQSASGDRWMISGIIVVVVIIALIPIIFVTGKSGWNSRWGQVFPRSAPSPPPFPEPVKSSRPATDLFVMSFCPFGVQTENAMEPVAGLLGTKADITVRSIATVNGTSVDSVRSFHGPAEAQEDLRQLCLAKYYPQGLWSYLVEFNKNCQNGSVRQNAATLASCGTDAAGKAGIDNQKIETCASGTEGLELVRADETITKKYQVSGSPTLIINGQKYSGQRTPDAFKQFICARFETQPAGCNVISLPRLPRLPRETAENPDNVERKEPHTGRSGSNFLFFSPGNLKSYSMINRTPSHASKR